jgi:UDP-glucose 4-epimerase
MKAIVFGGAGFLGGHVSDMLLKKGFEVTIFDINTYEYIKPGQEMILGNILDEEAVRGAVKGIPIVYNFAGIADIEEANEKPLDAIRNNILGNAIILEAIKSQKVERYVFSSTIYVYSNAGSFYRSSKQACESYIENYSEKYGMPYTILRYGSLYGPRANQTNPIYKVLKQALTEGNISYWGDGEEVREYIHAEDAARCSVEILDNDFVNQNVILTGHHPIKSKDLLVMINEICGGKIKVEFKNKQFDAHYEITPYSFSPKIGRKYVSTYYLDMGQGLLQCLEEIYRKNPEKQKKHIP